MKIILNGICGRMGKEVARMAKEGYRGASLLCGVDLAASSAEEGVPAFREFSEIGEDCHADCVIDFSHHATTRPLLAYCVAAHLPVVIATTGQDEAEKACIREAAEKIPIFFSANMSLGVALLCELAKTAARAMPDADIEIIETHHNRKLDAPSGTALMIADAVRAARGEGENVYGRSGKCPRKKGEIGIHAVRMGNIVGEHEVLVGTDTQTITLKHTAHTRALFAEGALAAAEFLIGKPAGLYGMNDMIK